MSDEWVETTLGGCYAHITTRATASDLDSAVPYLGLEHLSPEVPVVVTGGAIGDVSGQLSAFSSGDTLFGRLRPYLRKVSYAGTDGYCSPEILVLRPDVDVIHPRFLHLLASSESVIERAIANSAGSRMPRTSAKDLAETPVLLPPLRVQRRIVDLLEHLDTHLANLRAEESACLATLNRLRGKSWQTDEVLLETVVTDIQGGFSVRTGGDEPVAEQARVLKVSAVRPGRFQPSESKALNANTAMPDRALVSVGDLLITRSNTPDRVGYCARARTVPPRTFFPDLVWSLCLDETICDPDYFEQILASDTVRDRITATASGTSASMRKINRPGLRSVSIPLPTLAEQREFAETCLSAADTAEALSDEAQGLSQLRVQLLASLLSRDVEIPDSYDELLYMGVAS